MKIRVLLADDQALLRDALRLMLAQTSEIEVVGDTGDVPTVLELMEHTRPDLVITDTSLQGVGVTEMLRKLLEKYPQTRILALSGHADKRYVAEMTDAGALGYVTKSNTCSQVVEAIHQVGQGLPYYCPEVAAVLFHSLQPSSSKIRTKVHLGRREREVLCLLAEGRSSPQIGEHLHISPSTVDVHRRNIMRKLDLHSVAELTKYAIREGLTSF